MRFENKKMKNEKKREKNTFYNSKKHIYFTALFWLVLWLCIAKMICKA